ncbi:MAG TPA: GNAT family protein [Pyrinomonadaceae bacterium]|nr:GNAT family protein [Pyrinomonadaceae bacterium]
MKPRGRDIGRQVYLRRPSKGDLEEFVRLNKDSLQLHRGFTSPPTTGAKFTQFLARSRRSDCSCFLICRLSDRRIVGSINLSQIFLGGFRNAYLGYYIGGPYAGQGYMTEALQLVLRHAFVDLKLHRLEANVQPGNAPSIAVLKRAGFRLEGFSPRYLKVCGRWRDHERWAIHAEDWKRGRTKR